MVTVDLTPAELAMTIQRVDRYPTHVSSMEQNLVAKLRAAIPAPTVSVSLTEAQLDQIGNWFSYAENEGGASLHDADTAELDALLANAREKF
ncbi:hypothetical protein SEA_ZOOMAN_295 [Microbacterium phage Zooman]|nr:hypothetical protein SEA_ZOOMAN_295 [Microbacterium phage Zooman]